MEDKQNRKQNHPNGGFNSRRDDTWQQTSGDKRKPQLNETVCGCACPHRNVIGDRPPVARRVPVQDSTDEAFYDGAEGVDLHLLENEPTGPSASDRIRVPTRHSEYEINQNGTLLVDLESVVGMADDLPLHHMNSADSLRNHFPNSGEQSVASSGILSIRPESPAQVIIGMGAWSGPLFNIARSGFFFHRAPLPLVAPLRCCSCRSDTDTESYDNSSVDVRRYSSDFSGDDASMRSV